MFLCALLSSCADRKAMAEYLTEQGVKKMEEGDLEKAKSNFTYAVRLDPEYAPAFFHRGEVEMETEDYYRAAGDFHTAANLYKEPADKARAYSNESYSHLMTGHLDDAVETARKALENNPACADCHMHMGIALLHMGDLEKSLLHLNKCLELDVSMNGVLPDRAYVSMSLGNYKKAARDLDKYFESTEEPDVYSLVLYGYTLWGAGNIKKAVEYFEKARKEFPDVPEPFVALGDIEFSKGNIDSARDMYNKAVWTHKISPDAHLGRCAVEYLGGDYSSAYDDCNRAKSMYAPFPGGSRAVVLGVCAQWRKGDDKWVVGALEDFIEDGDYVEWRKPILEYMAGRSDEKRLINEMKKSNRGGNKRLCETYFAVAQMKLYRNEKSAKTYLNKTIGICPPYSMEIFTSKYQLKKFDL